MKLSDLTHLQRYFSKVPKEGLVGIEFGPDGLAVSYIEHSTDPDEPHKIVYSAFIADVDPKKQVEALTHLVKSERWAGQPCSVVLHPNMYQLLLVDAPDVPEDEMKDAMRFRVKDLVSYSLNECIVDIFQLPEDAYRGRLKMLYTAATSEEVVSTVAGYIEKSGLNLWQIEISELALRNLASLSPANEEGVAILWLKTTTSYINLCQNSDLYLSRKFEAGIGAAQATPQLTSFQSDMEQLTLEIQRSLDYYESQLGKGNIHKMYVAPLIRPAPGVLEYLQENLHVPVEKLDISQYFSDFPEMEETEQALCMTAIGTAIRSPSFYDQAAN